MGGPRRGIPLVAAVLGACSLVLVVGAAASSGHHRTAHAAAPRLVARTAHGRLVVRLLGVHGRHVRFVVGRRTLARAGRPPYRVVVSGLRLDRRSHTKLVARDARSGRLLARLGVRKRPVHAVPASPAPPSTSAASAQASP
ncbi:MAG: hypothetical protein ACRDLK_00090, partial [Gaiellaceae bacterium]